MNKFIFSLFSFSVIVLFLTSCQTKQEFTPLFNGQNLENWDKYAGSSLGGDFDSISKAATLESVFSVVEENGENIIRISGELNGSLATKDSYENYHLRLVFKWGERVYSQRNSGLLYHSFGEIGTAFGTWMTNIECQLMHQNLGDTYLMVNTTCESEATKQEGNNDFVYTPGSEVLAFGKHLNAPMIRKSSDNENPLGEWNTVDLYCFGGTAVHVVNGVVVMENKNTGTYEEGSIKPLTSGKIQIQSEGAELFVKSVDIEMIKSIPENIIPLK